MFHNFSDVYIMYRVPNVPGEVGAAELMDALWQHLEYEDVGQEEEEAASDEESVGGSSNQDQMNEEDEEEPPGLLPHEDTDEEEVDVEHHEEDNEEDLPGLLPLEDMDEEEVDVEHHEEDNEEEHVEYHEEGGHVRRRKRITRERINVGEKMNDYDYR